ncbi:MAG: TIGR04283 family arsenosugar biosynthesis glycosyltransferase [Deltaproteobacteria bacterium]|nr:TIGR04283 family arsenosugar biosynthesis glycosyltransferase [Deltaproteobacteria bacterium]
MTQPFVSVIIPSLNDEAHLKRNVSPLNQDPRIEVIVVPAKKVKKANRAYQMNFGARQAQCDLLVFLHADTKVNPDDLIELAQLMDQRSKLVGGAFRFALDQNGFKSRLIEFGVQLRERVFQLPYGDQAIFIRKSLFDEVGGYPDVPLLEDVLLVEKMKKKGTLCFYPKKAVTSARRWERHGYLKTTLVNWLTMVFWRLGVSLETIVNFRRRVFHDPVYGDVKKESARNHTQAA